MKTIFVVLIAVMMFFTGCFLDGEPVDVWYAIDSENDEPIEFQVAYLTPSGEEVNAVVVTPWRSETWTIEASDLVYMHIMYVGNYEGTKRVRVYGDYDDCNSVCVPNGFYNIFGGVMKTESWYVNPDKSKVATVTVGI